VPEHSQLLHSKLLVSIPEWLAFIMLDINRMALKAVIYFGCDIVVKLFPSGLNKQCVLSKGINFCLCQAFEFYAIECDVTVFGYGILRTLIRNYFNKVG